MTRGLCVYTNGNAARALTVLPWKMCGLYSYSFCMTIRLCEGCVFFYVGSSMREEHKEQETVQFHKASLFHIANGLLQCVLLAKQGEPSVKSKL